VENHQSREESEEKQKETSMTPQRFPELQTTLDTILAQDTTHHATQN
jgi:hypothetical protein